MECSWLLPGMRLSDRSTRLVLMVWMALKPPWNDDEILDLVGALSMRLMRRGRGLYGRFHDYNLADCILGMPPTSSNRDSGN